MNTAQIFQQKQNMIVHTSMTDLEVEDDSPNKTQYNGRLSISNTGCINVDQFDL